MSACADPIAERSQSVLPCPETPQTPDAAAPFGRRGAHRTLADYPGISIPQGRHRSHWKTISGDQNPAFPPTRLSPPVPVFESTPSLPGDLP